MKKIIIFLSLILNLYANDENLKVVYDLTTGDLKTFEKKLIKGIVANKTYYQSDFKELEVVVIIHGGAYKFFMKDMNHPLVKNDKALEKSYDELKKRVTSLSVTYDVEFYICKVGLEKRKIKKKDLLSFVKIVQNASIGLIDKQNEGFAYLPVGD